MMMRDLPRIDLHTHALYSDGISQIGDIVRQADTNKLDAIAITDHYHMIGTGKFNDYLLETREISEGASARVLVGLEIHPLQNFSLPILNKEECDLDLILEDPLGEDVRTLLDRSLRKRLSNIS